MWFIRGTERCSKSYPSSTDEIHGDAILAALILKRTDSCGLSLTKLVVVTTCHVILLITPLLQVREFLFLYILYSFFRACIFLPFLARPCYCFSSLIQHYGIYSPLCSGGYLFIFDGSEQTRGIHPRPGSTTIGPSICHLVPFTIISLF